MSEPSPDRVESPLFSLFRSFGVMDRLETLILEGRAAEVLCITGPLMGPFMGFTTAESDNELIDALTDHVWAELRAESEAAKKLLDSHRDNEMIPHIIELLKEKAPTQRLWALLEGIAYARLSPRPRLHSVIMLNILTEEAGLVPERQPSMPN